MNRLRKRVRAAQSARRPTAVDDTLPERLADLEARVEHLSSVADRDAQRIHGLTGLVSAMAGELRAVEAAQRDAEAATGQARGAVGLAQEILATSAWVQRLPPSDVLVSVVMPTHERPKLLADAIRSVLDQQHPNFELLVVDDGSGPDTAAVLAMFDDPRIRWFRRERNGGGAAARNIGLLHARGEYVAYLDDDNLIGPLWLRALIWAFETQPSCDLVYGAMVNDVEANAGQLPAFWQRPWDRQRLLLSNSIDQGMIAHRAGLPDLAYDEATPEAGDWDFVVRMTADRDAMRLPVIAVHYRTRHAGRISDATTMRAEVALTQQRFTRRGALRILVLDDPAAPAGGSPASAGEALDRLGDQVTWWRDAGRPDADELAGMLDRIRPDMVLTSSDPDVEGALGARLVPYASFAPGVAGDGAGEERYTVTLGRWDGEASFGVDGDDTALRGALLRQLDLMHARWLNLPEPGELPGDATIPLVDTRHVPGLVTVVRDAMAAPATPASIADLPPAPSP